jgi:hypothetical protein
MEQRQEACAQIIDLIAAEETNMANTRLKYQDGTGEIFQRNGGSNMSLAPYGFSGPSSNHGDSGLVGMIENVANIEASPHLKAQLIGALASISSNQGSIAALEGFLLNQGSTAAPPTSISSNQSSTPKPPPTGIVLESIVDMKLKVPKDMVGHLLGIRGSTIKEMIAKSHGARFDFEEKDRSDPSPIRTLTITGNFDQVQSAYNIVHEKAEEYYKHFEPDQNYL